MLRLEVQGDVHVAIGQVPVHQGHRRLARLPQSNGQVDGDEGATHAPLEAEHGHQPAPYAGAARAQGGGEVAEGVHQIGGGEAEGQEGLGAGQQSPTGVVRIAAIHQDDDRHLRHSQVQGLHRRQRILRVQAIVQQDGVQRPLHSQVVHGLDAGGALQQPVPA